MPGPEQTLKKSITQSIGCFKPPIVVAANPANDRIMRVLAGGCRWGRGAHLICCWTSASYIRCEKICQEGLSSCFRQLNAFLLQSSKRSIPRWAKVESGRGKRDSQNADFDTDFDPAFQAVPTLRISCACPSLERQLKTILLSCVALMRRLSRSFPTFYRRGLFRIPCLRDPSRQIYESRAIAGRSSQPVPHSQGP